MSTAGMLFSYLASVLAVSVVLVPLCVVACMLLWSCRARSMLTPASLRTAHAPASKLQGIKGAYAIVLDPSGNVTIGVQAGQDHAREGGTVQDSDECARVPIDSEPSQEAG